MNIFVGNLAPNVTEDQLVEAFKAFGQVKSAQVMRELFTGASKGLALSRCPAGRSRSPQSTGSTARTSMASRCA